MISAGTLRAHATDVPPLRLIVSRSQVSPAPGETRTAWAAPAGVLADTQVPCPLAAYEEACAILRDHVAAVAGGFKNGLYVHGDGGLGKSFVVLGELDRLGAPYCLRNSRMTAKGLFLALRARPDVVHVLEDCERITLDRDAQGVLRSAMWSRPGRPREVTWTTAKDGEARFEFKGGLIMTSNRPLSDLPELHALATRIEVFRMAATSEQLAALMRRVAASGHLGARGLPITPEGCLEVTEHLLAECHARGRALDLRLQQKAFATYLQWESGSASTHWRDLVAAGVREAAPQLRHAQGAPTRAGRLEGRREAARKAIAATDDPKGQVELYKELTDGGSRADFYRRKQEVENDVHAPEAR